MERAGRGTVIYGDRLLIVYNSFLQIYYEKIMYIGEAMYGAIIYEVIAEIQVYH